MRLPTRATRVAAGLALAGCMTGAWMAAGKEEGGGPAAPAAATLEFLRPDVRDGKPGYVSLSPAGDRLLYLTSGTEGDAGVWLADRAGTPQKRLLTERGAIGYGAPEWSPAGTHLAYVVLNSETGPCQFLRVGILDAAGAGKPREVPGIAFAWSPDGATLAVADPVGKKLRLLPAAAEGGAPARDLADFVDIGHLQYLIPVLRWSPDGKRLLYAATPEDAPKMAGGVWVAEREGGAAPRQVFAWKGGRVGIFPAWSPDGARIALLEERYESPEGTRLLVMNADGGEVREVYRSDGLDADQPPAWSPDGTRLAWARGLRDAATGLVGRARDVWTIAVAGGAPVPVTQSGKLGGRVRWLPDGKTLCVECLPGVALIHLP